MWVGVPNYKAYKRNSMHPEWDLTPDGGIKQTRI